MSIIKNGIIGVVAFGVGAAFNFWAASLPVGSEEGRNILRIIAWAFVALAVFVAVITVFRVWRGRSRGP